MQRPRQAPPFVDRRARARLRRFLLVRTTTHRSAAQPPRTGHLPRLSDRDPRSRQLPLVCRIHVSPLLRALLLQQRAGGWVGGPVINVA